MENTENTGGGEPIFAWQVPEYTEHERDKRWYILAIAFGAFLIVYSFFTDNYLLPIIVLIVAFIFILRHGQEAPRLDVSLSHAGLHIGQKFYDFDLFRNFSIVYKPHQGDTNLYFEFQSAVRPRISLPLDDETDPVSLRRFLLTHLDEDLERTDIPLSEQLSKRFKL